MRAVVVGAKQAVLRRIKDVASLGAEHVDRVAAHEVDLVEGVRNGDHQRVRSGPEYARVDVEDLLLVGIGGDERRAGSRVADERERVRRLAVGHGERDFDDVALVGVAAQIATGRAIVNGLEDVAQREAVARLGVGKVVAHRIGWPLG